MKVAFDLVDVAFDMGSVLHGRQEEIDHELIDGRGRVTLPYARPMDIAAEKYVSLVTFRRSGDPVHSPMWLAPLPGGRCGFSTDGTAGKVKRIRNNGTVTMQACSMRGVVTAGAPVVTGTAVVVEGDELDSIESAIVAKYGWQARIVGVPSAVKRLLRRPNHSVGIVVTLDA
ncbi:MAG: class F420-dependent oxidoreductase [Ilumatobacteraceae bacterium]|nr:class F420-dependent oxidoreductase [Ilumatobacteraceae bacterium]MCU1390170.1 class F420-dependent oxidoreductase [Ilumatobacteraceae bacterium]